MAGWSATTFGVGGLFFSSSEMRFRSASKELDREYGWIPVALCYRVNQSVNFAAQLTELLL
jgi:hypothetical protein